MIKVFIIDDSLTVRNSIIKIFKDEKDIKVIGEASNPVDAMAVFKEVGFPDVFILDIEMPKMDGLTFFKKLNDQNPTPVIICSTMVSLGSNAAIDALRLGATEIILKPQVGLKEFFLEEKEKFIRAVKTAVRSKVHYKAKVDEKKEVSKVDVKEGRPSNKLILIGSSTGGVQVLEDILTKINTHHKGIVITQHMPEGFTLSFASRLNSLVKSKIVEAKDGEVIADNKVIIAKGGIHTEIVQDGSVYKIRLRDFPKVNSHKPSVDVLFGSASKVCDKIMAFVLTGMGNDGAMGLKKLKEKGNLTYIQEEKSCVVYGMPKAAKELDAQTDELTIDQIINTIDKFN